MGTGKQWIGAVGAVRVKHEEYNGNMGAKVAYCINKGRQDKLPAWKDVNGVTPAVAPTISDDDLPF
jgi:hypothetical protein